MAASKKKKHRSTEAGEWQIFSNSNINKKNIRQQESLQIWFHFEFLINSVNYFTNCNLKTMPSLLSLLTFHSFFDKIILENWCQEIVFAVGKLTFFWRKIRFDGLENKYRSSLDEDCINIIDSLSELQKKHCLKVKEVSPM